MKIASYEASILLVPEDDPLANMPEEAGRKRPIVTVRLRTDSGIEGIGVTLYGGRLTRSLHAAVEDLAAATVGEDPQRVESIVAKLRLGDPGGGPGGIFTLALSAIDTALWDIKGKALDQPLWKLLGGHRDRVPTYASGSLRRGLSDDQAQRAAQILLQKGFREMKTQMALPGHPTPAEEVRRVRVVREAIGPDIKLMCDINQRWRPEQAIQIGSRVEEEGIGLFWLEDVTTFDDYPPAIFTRFGGLIGAVLFKLVQDYLANVTPQYWQFWLGLVLVMMILFGRVYGAVMAALIFAICTVVKMPFMQSIVFTVVVVATLGIARPHVLNGRLPSPSALLPQGRLKARFASKGSNHAPGA